MKNCLTIFTIIFLFLVAVKSLSAQNKNSVQGDFEALQALYNSTQGQGVPTLSSVNKLPSIDDATYPYMYIVNGEIHALERDHQGKFTKWTNFGEPWKDKTGWIDMTPETMGDAVGIEVDNNGRVIAVDMQKITTKRYAKGEVELAGNNLVGVLPNEIGNLQKIKYWNVKQNFFHGPIPESIENWKESIRLSFGGQNDELDLENRTQWHEGNHRFVHLDGGGTANRGKKVVATNRFQTDVPFGINGFPNLELIEIRHQYLTGTLPEWDDLPSIKGIFLSETFDSEENTISGPIPESWGNLTTVVWLDLLQKNRSKRYSGDIPKSLDNWEQLANIKLVNNNFTGPVPEFLNARDKIYVTLGENNFTGGFPTGYFNGDNARLSKWGIGRNNLSGTLPETVPSPTYPRVRSNYAIDAPSIGFNDFEGELPEWFVSMLGIQVFNIIDNNFTGPFPAELANQNKLKTVFLNGNNLSGPLPDVDWGDRRIGWFYIQNNNFEGEIPESWITLFQDGDGNWHNSVRRFNLSNNNLSGRIPDWPKNLDIDQYSLDRNRFTFVDIGPVYEILKDAIGDGFSVDNQKPFGKEQSRTMPEGETVIFDLSEYDYPGNSYQWFKNGNALDDESSPVMTVTDVSEEVEGSYVLEVKNIELEELGTHQSQPIIFEIGEDDGLNGGANDNDDGASEGDDSESDAGSAGREDFPSAPVLYGPADDAKEVSISPEFSWSNNNSDYYIIHVSRMEPTGMALDITIEDTTFTPDEIFDDGTVHDWRVRGVKNGELGEWSEIQRFTTSEEGLPDVARLVSPGHFEQEVDPLTELVWEASGADSYEVRVFNKKTAEIVLLDESVTSTYTPGTALPDTTEFLWQVKSVDGGVQGAWGPRWEFSTGLYKNVVEAPSLIAPGQGSEYDNLKPFFEWSEVNAEYYVITVTKEEPTNAKSLPGVQNNSVVIYDETLETHYMPGSALDPETRYYWRVQAVKDGKEGEWSDVWEFTTPEQQTVSTVPGEQPLKTDLGQNYPNPFNPTTQIEFSLSDVQNVSLRVYDMAGRRVATLVEGVQQAGRHTASFNADNLASGVYFYRFITDTHQFTRKMTLVK